MGPTSWPVNPRYPRKIDCRSLRACFFGFMYKHILRHINYLYLYYTFSVLYIHNFAVVFAFVFAGDRYYFLSLSNLFLSPSSPFEIHSSTSSNSIWSPPGNDCRSCSIASLPFLKWRSRPDFLFEAKASSTTSQM